MPRSLLPRAAPSTDGRTGLAGGRTSASGGQFQANVPVISRMMRPCSTLTSGYGTLVLICIWLEPAIMFA